MGKKLLLHMVLFFCFWQAATAQVKQPKDSTKVYNTIEEYSKKRKFTKFVHRLIFRPTQKTTTAKRKKQTRPKTNEFAQFEHKIIRNIKITTLDPFGFSVDDSLKAPKKWAEKAGNSIHIKTKKWAVRNYLLFKKNDALDSLLIKESERLLQQQRFTRNVIIKPVAVKGSKDSVDISIRVLDSWSLIPTGSISTSRGNLEITERNFMGIGHEFENNFKQRFDDSENAYGMRYTIPNFKDTFISSTFLYDIDFDDYYTKGVNIDRSFFSPYTRWAAGVSFQQRFYKDSLSDAMGNKQLFNFKHETQDYWGGHSFRIFEGNSEADRISNLVTTFRFANVRYLEKPGIAFDSIQYFSSSKLYLTSIGIASRKYVETKYLFNNGIPEYVQIGKNYSVTTGFRNKNNIKNPYFAGKFSFGGFYRWGYFSGSFEIGSFFNQGRSQESVLRLQAHYFTDLIELGNWKIRQYVMPQLTVGNNRLPIDNDRITLAEPNGIQGFNDEPKGTNKFLIGFQTQTYAPGQLFGFRMSPFFNATFGLLGDDYNPLWSSRLYSSFGLGVLISNDYLVFNSFQISFAYYPTIPGSGDNLLKTNTFKNNDVRLPDFQIGKPAVIPFE